MKKHGPVYVIVYTTMVALCFGLALSSFGQFTKGNIDANKQAKIRRQILLALDFEVPEEATSEQVLKQFDDFVIEKEYKNPEGEEGYITWEGYSEPGFSEGKTKSKHNGVVSGYAFKVGGTGFWGPVKGILALEPDLTIVKGITFYEDEETPGLGHEINKPFFRDSFKGKSYCDESGKVGFIFSLKKDKAQNEVDTITGATETVKSVKAFLKKNIEEFLLAVKKYNIGKG